MNALFALFFHTMLPHFHPIPLRNGIPEEGLGGVEKIGRFLRLLS